MTHSIIHFEPDKICELSNTSDGRCYGNGFWGDGKLLILLPENPRDGHEVTFRVTDPEGLITVVAPGNHKIRGSFGGKNYSFSKFQIKPLVGACVHLIATVTKTAQRVDSPSSDQDADPPPSADPPNRTAAGRPETEEEKAARLFGVSLKTKEAPKVVLEESVVWIAHFHSLNPETDCNIPDLKELIGDAQLTQESIPTPPTPEN